MQRIDVHQVRAATIGRLTAGALDVLVVGGGIVGAGIARDAAMRGLRVGLVEQHDLASGTSSRSSRLLHGGLRYLAQGRLALVREASREKCILHGIAPHLAEPLAFVFPTYRGSPWPLWQLRLGVKLYDLLCDGRNLGSSRSFDANGIRSHLPGVDPHGLTGGVRYFDGLTNDARLVLDTLRSAGEHGAIIANYTRFEDASPGGGRWKCLLRDVLADQPFEAEALTVVNATGPWAQALPHSSVRLRLTKGVHLVIDRRRLPVPDAVVMAEGRRILFAIPWGERAILGTTDTDYDRPIDDVCTEPADVDYVLNVTNRAFPDAGLTQADIVSAWAGLRPLIASGRGGPSDISRAHQILMPQPGWFDVAGGKLTTYRLIAEQTVDRLYRHLGRGRPPCRTAEEPLRASGRAQFHGVPAVDAAEAASYGPVASGVLPPPVGAAMVERYCADEWAVHLDDVMLRRSGWHFYHADAAAVAERVAGWMAECLDWDAAQQTVELARYHNLKH
jgi:glycerol-3-phosphate dehydrogenase